ncbi:2-polyprenyl-6-methoxyphenol hydroxylase [Aspergillus taichungensis]|uniref:2-polyprenyl-6-methoxyphenol hydroxylase n=1 Tax=Aspergillus taichungensis TaxID=482145 RepID=A0A2J5HLY0_9EURO|nr:2-polyprenyl-6-methoxyphenol hydroxylase [Aspergillus taichungensis]
MADIPVSHTDVLIIGAGPSGLAAAYWMARCGIKARVIDKRTRKVMLGHADGLRTRTLELFDSIGFQHKVLHEAQSLAHYAFWRSDGNGGLHRHGGNRQYDLLSGSPYFPMGLSQARIERFFLDTIRECSDIDVERGIVAESLAYTEDVEIDESDTYPITVKLRALSEEEANAGLPYGDLRVIDRNNVPQDEWDDLTPKKTKNPGEKEVLKAKFIIGCDGAHSWTRKQLDIPLEGSTTEALWGVMDVIPITDFPDIRRGGFVATEAGTMLLVSRERQLTRFYVSLKDVDEEASNRERSSVTLDMISKRVQAILSPYRFNYEICDWWTAYQVGQRLAPTFSRGRRMHLAGDAVHTHSPKIGLGMNTSIQDGFNIGWKIALVLKGIAHPSIIDTYDLERHRVAEEVLHYDRNFFAHFQEDAPETGPSPCFENKAETMRNVLESFLLFAEGYKSFYQASPLVLKEATGVAGHLEPGERLPLVKICNQADGASEWTSRILKSDGRFRILVLAGDMQVESQKQRVVALSQYLDSPCSVLQRFTPKGHNLDSVIEVLTIHSLSVDDIELSEFPEVLRLLDRKRGWGYDKVWSDSVFPLDRYCDGKAYETWGVDRVRGALVVVRPDQYIGWTGELEDVDGLSGYFDGVLREPKC